MSSSLNRFILLGLICQGFSWDNLFLPSLNALLWVLCLKLPRKPIHIPPVVECLLIAMGIIAGGLLAKSFGQSAHFAVGHGLTLLQLVRLMRPLDKREKIFSLLVAFVHLGVGCTIVLDYRFILILIATAMLIPGSLRELAADPFADASGTPSRRPAFALYAGILVVMVVFFITFPRGLLGTALPRAFGDQNQPSLLDSVLDPTRGGMRNSTEIIMQVQAKSIGYMKSFALIDFEDGKWTSERAAGWQRIYLVPQEDLKDYEHRRVRVKNVAYLGRVLPIDGRVVYLQGKFFRRAFLNFHGAIECESMWNTSNNIYEYWIDTNAPPDNAPLQLRRLLRHPQPSAQLMAWMDERLTGISDSFAQAKALEDYFQRNFKYTLGAPELNRVNHLDDFIFNQREGHCERYASALTLLLRMKGIPSRVVIGYAPGARNWVSGWYDVRFSDAHAWTEAWFEGRGWVRLDATPSATTPKPNYFFRDMLDALDVLWYLHIVNFDAPAQRDLLSGTINLAISFSVWARQNANWLIGIALAILSVIGWRNRPASRQKEMITTAKQRAHILAEHYYGQMLRLLAKQEIHREAHQTPLEFLRTLRQHESFPDIRIVTEIFCATRYGNAPMTNESKVAVESALERIRAASETPPMKRAA